MLTELPGIIGQVVGQIASQTAYETSLEPHYTHWSDNGEWLTLAWDFDDESLGKLVQELAGPPATMPKSETSEESDTLRTAPRPGVYLPLR